MLSYNDERRAIGFDVSVHRLSPGKAGMDGRIHHHQAGIIFAFEKSRAHKPGFSPLVNPSAAEKTPDLPLAVAPGAVSIPRGLN
jgi:hypothetical protein